VTSPDAATPPGLSAASSATGAEPTLARRIAFRSGGQLLSLPLNLVLQAIVPRALGAAAYGDYSYLSAFFTSVIGFVDTGTSQAYYNKLSQRPHEAGLTTFYTRFVLAAAAALALFTFAGYALGAGPRIWPHATTVVVVLAATMALGNWVIAVAGKAVDAHALTTGAEIAALVARILLVTLAGTLFLLHSLSLTTFLTLQNALNALLVGLLLLLLSRHGHGVGLTARLPQGASKRYAREFWRYSHPLLTYSLLALVATLADRYLLQRASGSVQQGFLGLGLQVGSVVFIFGGAIAGLLAREFARAYHGGDLDRLRRDYQRFLPATYSVTTYFGVFLAVEASVLVELFGGSQFRPAGAATAILCLYPMHQVFGQIGGSLMYATDRTGESRDIGIVGLGGSLLLTALLFMPQWRGGAPVSAAAVAGKMVLQQIIVVNAVLWANARFLRIRFRGVLARQLISPIVCGACALPAHALTRHLDAPLAARFVAAGVVYTTFIVLLLAAWPELLGIPRDVLRGWVYRARTR
jgi:O-antigen/teichoic acid export membrane protein